MIILVWASDQLDVYMALLYGRSNAVPVFSHLYIFLSLDYLVHAESRERCICFSAWIHFMMKNICLRQSNGCVATIFIIKI